MRKLLVLPLLLLTGCNAGEVSRYITLLAQLAQNALVLANSFQGKAVAAGDLQVISGWSTLLQKTATDAEANKNAGQSQLVAVLTAAETNLPAYLASARVQDAALRNRIEVGTTAFLTVVESIAAFYPREAPPPSKMTMQLPDARVYTLPPRAKAPIPQIKSLWNAACLEVTSCQVR
jgi:hypothetical protein